MGRHSIKELERLSGIKAHTLRIWEKRYNLFEPNRTETNIREYSDDDLKNLLKISTLTKSGIKISKIVSYSDTEIDHLVASIEDEQIINQKRVDDLIIPMIEFDEEEFNRLYNNYVNELGIETTFIHIIYPFLEKIGILWLTDDVEPAQEHFITHLIRQKISVEIENIPQPGKNAKKIILFLPEGEYHELGLLYLYFTYKLKGHLVYYLGQSIPTNHISVASHKIQPDWVLTYTVVNPKGGIQKLINELGECKTQKVMLLIGPKNDTENYLFNSKVQQIKSFQDALV